MKLVYRTTILASLLTPPVLHAEISARSALDEVVDTIKHRTAVLSSVGDDLAIQFSLPPQYPQCLFAAFTESKGNNNVAHNFLLGQIDFLSKAGLSIENTTALISYGHALLNYSYAIEKKRPLDNLTEDDFTKLKKYGYQMFVKHSCVELFDDERTQKALVDLVRTATKKNIAQPVLHSAP